MRAMDTNVQLVAKNPKSTPSRKIAAKSTWTLSALARANFRFQIAALFSNNFISPASY